MMGSFFLQILFFAVRYFPSMPILPCWPADARLFKRLSLSFAFFQPFLCPASYLICGRRFAVRPCSFLGQEQLMYGAEVIVQLLGQSKREA